MRKNFGPKTMCYPMPVYIIATYNADGTPNAMNAAWGGISEEKEISICIDSGHKTAENLIARGAFTVSMATADQLIACDYVGIVSGNKEPDKFAKAGFHATRSQFVDAPIIDELPMALECKVISYDTETCLSEFVRFLSAGDDAHIVAGSQHRSGGHRHSKGLPGHQVFGGLVGGIHTDGDLRFLADAAPGGVHGVGGAVGVVGGDDVHRHGVAHGLGSEVLSHDDSFFQS